MRESKKQAKKERVTLDVDETTSWDRLQYIGGSARHLGRQSRVAVEYVSCIFSNGKLQYTKVF